MTSWGRVYFLSSNMSFFMAVSEFAVLMPPTVMTVMAQSNGSKRRLCIGVAHLMPSCMSGLLKGSAAAMALARESFTQRSAASLVNHAMCL